MSRAAPVVAMLFCAACTVALPQLSSEDAGQVDQGIIVDVAPPDAPHADEAAPQRDLPLDAGRPRVHGCSAPAVVGEQTSLDLHVPALSPDGLTIYARTSSNWYAAKRTDLQAPFGEWSLVTGLDDLDDLSFYNDPTAGTRVVAAFGDPGSRAIVDCAVGAPCGAAETVEITLPTQVADTDMDGPDMVVLDGQIFFSFNAGADRRERNMLLARREGEQWVAEQLFDPPAQGDDPALSADGLITLFSSSAEDLWVATRSSLVAPFIAAEALPEPINTDKQDRAPELFSLPGSPPQLELFFESDRESPRAIYRSVCEVSRDS